MLIMQMKTRSAFPKKMTKSYFQKLWKIVEIDPKLCIEKHIEQIYAKTKVKLKALARIGPFKNIQEKKVLMKAFLRLNLDAAY